MKYSTRLSDAVHILAFIYLDEGKGLSSTDIANSIRTNPAYVRQLMSSLRKGGLIISTRGRSEPALARPPSEISMLDVYRAVEGDKQLLHLDTHTNPECCVGVQIQLSLKDYFDEIQAGVEQHMSEITLGDVVETYRIRCERAQS